MTKFLKFINLGNTSKSLVVELTTKVKLYFLVSLFIFVLFLGSIQFFWHLTSKRRLEDRLQSAIAHSLEVAVRESDLIGIQRTLRAFQIATPNSKICIELPNGQLVADIQCNLANYKLAKVPLTNYTFKVGVDIEGFGREIYISSIMVIFVATLAGLLIFYLVNLTQKIIRDLSIISKAPDDQIENRYDLSIEIEYSEFKSLYNHVKERSALQKENERLIQAKRVVEIARQVAHDIRSPLSALSVLSTSLAEEQPDKSDLIKRVIGRINGIAQDLLMQSRQGVIVQPRTTEMFAFDDIFNQVNDLVSEKKIEFKHRTSTRLDMHPKDLKSLDTKCASSNFSVRANPVELKRVLSNLINNSYEAIDNSDGQILIKIDENPKGIQIEVLDNGQGMSQNVLTKLGTNQFTTKDASDESGNGLGIYNAKKTIESWGGELIITSDIGQGSIFRISLPYFDHKASTQEQPTI